MQRAVCRPIKRSFRRSRPSGAYDAFLPRRLARRPPPVVVALGLTQTLAWGSTFYLPAILAGPMAADTGTANSFVYLAFSRAMGISALLGPWAGRRIDRHGGRAMLGASNLILAACMNKQLVKAKPLAPVRSFFENRAHLTGLAAV